MNEIKLRDPNQLPNNELLKNVLNSSYSAYELLFEKINSNDFLFEANWNFYKDGNAWLCKVCYKKKTVFWFSVWDSFFKIGFYFTEKNCSGIFELEIDEKIKKDFVEHKPVGKLKPLVIEVTQIEQIKDVLLIAQYKKGLK
jgi:hypothetical protein